jgi:hypothetical protein
MKRLNFNTQNWALKQTGERKAALFRQWIFLLIAYMILGPFISYGVSLAETENRIAMPGLFASFDRDAAKVGATVELTLSYRLPTGGHLSKKPEIKGLEHLTVIKRFSEPDQIRIRLLVDRLGTWTLGPLRLTYLDIEEKFQILKTKPISLTVLSNLEKGPFRNRIRPIQGILSTASLWLQNLFWAVGLFSILLAAIAVVRRNKITWAEKEPTTSVVPPHIRACKEIQQLEARELFEKGLIKEFYFGFSEIMRRYLEAFRNFPAMEFTTEEIAHHLDSEKDRKLVLLLLQTDRIKFADTIPTQAEKVAHVRIALAFIQETGNAAENGHLSESSRAGITIAGTKERRSEARP